MERSEVCETVKEFRIIPQTIFLNPALLKSSPKERQRPMRNIFVLAVLFLFCAVPFIFSQTNQKTKSSQTDPFKLENGSFFSASKRPRAKQENGISEEPVEIQRDKITADYIEALDLIRANYVDSKKINNTQLTKSSLTAMLRTLDPHSNYFDPVEYEALLDDQNSEYTGIGCSIANFLKNGVSDTYITSTYPDSPAMKAGLRFGDKILAVNGEIVTNKQSYEVREKIRGPKGTLVKLTLERGFSQKIEVLEIRRGVVPQPSIPDSYLIRPGIGYIELSNGFNFTTSDELDIAINSLRQQGMTSLVLDLRDNPGGIVDQAVRVAEKFLPAGQIVLTQRGRFEIDNRVWKSLNKNPEQIPLVVLVDEGTASASEIVAGALQDHDRALIIGEKTFGKGLVQSVIDLPLRAGLTLTTAKYYTPSGRSIQRDYSSIGIYDYFNHKLQVNKTKSSQTDTGRIVFGGDGITPDDPVKNPQLSQFQIGLIDPLFFFTLEIANGRVSEFESYRIVLPIKFGIRVHPSDFPESEGLFNSFKNFLLKNKSISFTPDQLESDKKFIINRLRYYLATSAFGNVTANQILIENDLQVAKALEALPRAQNLALAARKTTTKNK